MLVPLLEVKILLNARLIRTLLGHWTCNIAVEVVLLVGLDELQSKTFSVGL